MTREDYAKQINWNGTATRIIQINEIPHYEIGAIINPGLCWTDGGEFTIETAGEYGILFRITENTEGHEIDYDNEEECQDLGCEDCYNEKEILINKNFKVLDFWEWDEETGFAEVFLGHIIPQSRAGREIPAQ